MSIPSLNSLSEATGGIFVPDEIAKELNMIIRDKACVEKFARHLPMKRSRMIRRKQDDGVGSYWVNAMQVKPKDAPTFETYELVAEKLAVIIPLEDQLVEDADTDLASVIRTDVTGEFTEMLDRTYMGYETTSPFTMGISPNTPANHTIANGTGVDLGDDFSEAMSTIEVCGFDVTGAIAHPGVKHVLRTLRDANNQPIFAENLRNEVTSFSLWGVPLCFTSQVLPEGSPETTEILLMYGPYVMIGDRVGLQISKSTEATLTQGTEEPINLWEQDMHAYRFVTRKGFVIKDEDALAKVTGIQVHTCD